MKPKSVEYLRQRLAKPPDGRHDPRTIFGSGLTMERIQSTIYSADWGNPRALTDLSRETLQLDPHLSAVLTKRIGAVASLPIDVLPAKGPGIDPKRAAFYAEVVRAQLSRIPNMKQAIRQLAWGLFDGRAVLEKQWGVAPGANTKFGQVTQVVTMLSWIHPRRIFFGPDRELRVVDRPIGIGFSRDGQAFRDHPHKFIEFTPQLFAEYPEREGLARPCLYWAFFKRFGARERMILLELFAKPWRWGEVDNDQDLSSEELADLDTIVEQIAGNGYARLPRGAKLHVENVAQNIGANGSIHKEVIDQSDAQISKLVLGQTGTTDAKAQGIGGNQSVVMKDEQDQICVSDAGMIEEVLEDYLSDDIIEVNFGPSAVTHAPRIKLHADTVDRPRELGRLKSALDVGLEVSLDEAYELSGYRKPDPDEPILRNETPASAGMAPDGSPLPPGAPRPSIVYPVGKAPGARVVAPSATQEGGPSAPSAPPEGSSPAIPSLPGPIGEDDPIVRSPEGTDPGQAGNASGTDDLKNPTETGGPAKGPQPENTQRPGVATPSDLKIEDQLDPVDPARGYGGVGGYDQNDPLESDNVPRGVFERRRLQKRTLVGDVVMPQASATPTSAPSDRDASPTPEPGRTAVPPDVQPVSMVPSLELPMGPYSDFDDCVADQKKKGHSDASAHKICGAIKEKIEGGVQRAVTISNGAVDETGARRLIRSLGTAAEGVILAMRVVGAESRADLMLVKEQPKTPYGSPEPIVKKATKLLAVETRGWGDQLSKAGAGKETASQIYSAVYGAYSKLDHEEFARELRRRIVHTEMLGALDSHYERKTDETVPNAKFEKSWFTEIFLLAADEAKPKEKPTYSDLSYKPAAEFFNKKQVVPRSVFDTLSDGAKTRAFTVARMSSRSMLDLVHAELGRMIAEGADLKDFQKFMKDRIESAGWVPASPSHVETIARTNLMQGYTVGRLKDMTAPATLLERPYWQIRGVKDDRQRETHGAVNGWVLRADDAFFQKAMPGTFGFNCRCRPVTLSESQVKKRGLEVHHGSEIQGLPDPGFSGSGASALLSAFGAR